MQRGREEREGGRRGGNEGREERERVVEGERVMWDAKIQTVKTPSGSWGLFPTSITIASQQCL